MSDTPTDVLLSGRVVMGHPMDRNNMTRIDDATKQEVPVLDKATGLQATQAFFALAIPKTGEPDWRQTPWGKSIYERGVKDWPNGEHAGPSFAWKITDGDSMVPNTKGKVPSSREGFPGNWVVNCTTRFNVSCYHVGKYDPLQQIADSNEIKTGDYARVSINVRGNGPSKSPGVYVNPRMFELSRAGQAIISESGPSANEVFGNGGVAQTPQPTPSAPTPGAGPSAPEAPTLPPAPAHDLLNQKYQLPDGTQWTKEQLMPVGYTDEDIAKLPRIG